ncbi:hypothetical protein MG293_017862 [Ovis ammon polii]|uniref:Uncharacterized protein n=1 Tax=Ovis ammon polii TaxID=230172 RepID=A0AAD4TU32_OVIAM|nr:hypothetical protein MG293_017862 [Ovis ammon polii]
MGPEHARSDGDPPLSSLCYTPCSECQKPLGLASGEPQAPFRSVHLAPAPSSASPGPRAFARAVPSAWTCLLGAAHSSFGFGPNVSSCVRPPRAPIHIRALQTCAFKTLNICVCGSARDTGRLVPPPSLEALFQFKVLPPTSEDSRFLRMLVHAG